MSNALDQQWKYDFQFSLPIQAVAPLSRDPNLLPLPMDDAQPPVCAFLDQTNDDSSDVNFETSNLPKSRGM